MQGPLLKNHYLTDNINKNWWRFNGIQFFVDNRLDLLPDDSKYKTGKHCIA